MEKIILISLALGLVLLSGCNEPHGPEYYKDIPSAPVPEACEEVKNDACGLFDCMVDLCWCLERPDQILVEGSTIIENTGDAAKAVENYLDSPQGTTLVGELADYELREVQLNSVFYNVFAEDSSGNEEVFTVAADGTIIQTVCGV